MIYKYYWSLFTESKSNQLDEVVLAQRLTKLETTHYKEKCNAMLK